MTKKRLLLVALLLAIAAAVAWFFMAHQHGGKQLKFGKLTIVDPTIRESVPGAKVAAGYLTILNGGPETETLLSVSSSVSAKSELHKMEVDPATSVMKMGEMETPPTIAPGDSAQFLPGGNHIMLMQLAQPLKAGEVHVLEMTFEKAGKIAVPFDVKSIGDTMHMNH